MLDDVQVTSANHTAHAPPARKPFSPVAEAISIARASRKVAHRLDARASCSDGIPPIDCRVVVNSLEREISLLQRGLDPFGNALLRWDGDDPSPPAQHVPESEPSAGSVENRRPYAPPALGEIPPLQNHGHAAAPTFQSRYAIVTNLGTAVDHIA